MDVHMGTQDSLNISSSQNRTEGVQNKEMGQSLAPHHLPIAINASTRVRNRQTKIKPCGSCARVLPQHLLPPTAALQQGSSRLTWHKGSCRARLTPLLRILPISEGIQLANTETLFLFWSLKQLSAGAERNRTSELLCTSRQAA